VLEVVYHHAKFSLVRISPTAGAAAKNAEFRLFVYPYVKLVNVRVVRTILPRRRWSTERTLTPLNRGRFVVVHSCSTFSDCRHLATPQNAEFQKKRQNLGFLAARERQNKPIETKFGT